MESREGPGLKAVANETQSFASRTTREGKKYSYELLVLQQPTRARACGAGAKSSADRRPVDPPPIVRLKIFEVDDQSKNDVTFGMNANYFLFATLEQARVMANGRVGSQDQKGLTVLTGTPVAGMVCLERPDPAGYFIFPDLSVRHEGYYRLSFSLYEELREAKDEDQGEEVPRTNGNDGSHVTHRLEVKSKPFQVYSAKKFPGLTESTSLSRTVAEQGCRVRIRRDVRMRKREGKSGKDWEGYEDETADARARMSATPEAAGYAAHGFDPVPRPRSNSNTSHHSIAPSLTLSRRPSQQEMSQGYHPTAYGTAPHTPQSAYPQTSPYGASPASSYAQAPFVQQPSSMQPPPPQYQHPSYQQQPPMSQAAPPQHGYYSHGSAAPPPPPVTSYSPYPPPPPTYESQEQQHHRMSMEYNHPQHDHHRFSSQFTAPLPPPAVQPSYAPPSQSNYYAPPPPQHQPSYSTPQRSNSIGHKPLPLEPVQPPTRTTGASTPTSARAFYPENRSEKLPPIASLNHNMHGSKLEPAAPISTAPHSGYQATSAGSRLDSHKRGYGEVFREQHQPLRYGARPSESGNIYYPTPTEVDDNDSTGGSYEDSQRYANYRRADGRSGHRYLQQPEDEVHA
ncbi:velum formation- protein [Saxophila tyrrhenica]|uniref:Velum formation- protein n=1 Tax=Saxophila tyrrhenica TaxID=1690608 RepID=A0AAV9PK71_9PEZI|nr:velum formation- protein [Saxophila tyrrhenica]